jgi:DNA repair protein RadC
LATSLLAASGGLVGIARLGTAGLVAQVGMGPAKAARVAAAFELGQRALCEVVDKPRLVLASVDDVADWARPRLGALEHEELWLLCLDGRNALKSACRVAQGGLHGCGVTPKDVLRPALHAAASAIIVLHNHPSGSAEPSSEDIEMTRHLAFASSTLGIALLDHVIVARKRTCSLAQLGVIP